MALPLLEAHGLTAVTADGVILFSDLDFVLDRGVVGLVGRNGCGKSTLARILAGTQRPAAGSVQRHGRIGFLPQEVRPAPGARLIDLLGLSREWSALQRIQAGSCAQEDFDAVGGQWGLEAAMERWLCRFGLGHLAWDAPADRCSGGELTRLGLIGLLLKGPDLLILDEPSNHLDGRGREQLTQLLGEWPGGALIVTHDRGLLEQAGRILELSSLGLSAYPGPWSTYERLKAGERRAASHRYEVARAEHQGQRKQRQAVLERQQQRQSRGRKGRREANQAKILLDFAAQGSEATAGRIRRQQAGRLEEAAEHERQARMALEASTPVTLTPAPGVPSPRRVLTLREVTMGFGERVLFAGLSLELSGAQRLAVRGPNGSGKSTLLKLMGGLLQAQSGDVEIAGSVALLDQHQGLLRDGETPLENFRRLAPGLTEAEYRTRLARLGLGADHVRRPTAVLSGGERLKLALACTLLGPQAPSLLLLDEPTNHQDLESVAALEEALRGYGGALVVVSHDRHFLERVGPSHELRLDETPPRVTDWASP
jgi:ATPase subunit of ABC transporter with duplicated ATPase domains